MADIEIRLERLEQLYDLLDPAPFRDKALDRAAEAYLLECAEDAPGHEPLRLMVRVPTALVAREAEVADAVHAHFGWLWARADKRRAARARMHRFAMLLGVFVLLAALGLRGLFAEGGGIAVEGLPAGSPLPAVLPTGQYEMKQTRDTQGVNIFYLAISLIIMGVGFLKPNISSIVGQLYPQGDPRRDSGFTLYYYGINLGSFWAAVLCGLLGQTVGWWAGFGLAGVGMALGWVVFVLGKPLLEGKGEAPNPELIKRPVLDLGNKTLVGFKPERYAAELA